MAVALPLERFFLSASGISRGSADRVIAELKTRGLLQPNAVYNLVELSATEMAYVTLSAIGMTAADHAPALAVAFGACRYICTPGAGGDQAPRMGPGSVVDLVARMVAAGRREAIAFDDDQLAELWASDQGQALPHSVQFRVNPLTVELVWPDRTDVYAPPVAAALSAEPKPWAGGAIDHIAMVPFAVFSAAGRALLELQRRRERKLVFNRVPAAPSGGPETQNAEALAGASASNCDRENARPGSLNSPGCKERLRPAQASPVRRHGRSS